MSSSLGSVGTTLVLVPSYTRVFWCAEFYSSLWSTTKETMGGLGAFPKLDNIKSGR